jgi:hypothetical protein
MGRIQKVPLHFRILLKRSNTIGRIDLYGRSDGQEPHQDPVYERIQLVDVLKDLNVTASDPKTIQVVLCTDCAEVADRHIPDEKLLFDELTRLKNFNYDQPKSMRNKTFK